MKARNRPEAATAGKVAVFGRPFAVDVPRTLHGRKFPGLLESE